MTPTDLEALARRAVACPKWRWMPGMLYHTQEQSNRLTDDHFVGGLKLTPICLPDLTDPATLGCLLALVREAWNDPTLGLFAVRGGRSGRPARVWAFGGRKPRRRGFDHSIASAFFGSEAAALVFGLEAAP
jgi:hypothetical protein